MNGIWKHYGATLIFAGLIVSSLIVGGGIPGFYAWTDSDQSRPSPLLWQVPAAWALAAVLFCISLPWLPIARDETTAAAGSSLRFNVRALLVLTAAVGATIVMLTKFPLIGGGVMTVGMFAYFVYFWWYHAPHRLAATALVACMFLPYAWIVGYQDVVQLLPFVVVRIGILPTFLPAIWLGHLAGASMHDSPGMAYLLTAIEFAAGLWLIRLGPRRTVAYLLLVLLVSALGSLGFYQAVRA